MALLERPCFYCQALCPPVAFAIAILSMLSIGEYAVKDEANHGGVKSSLHYYLSSVII